MAHRRRSHRGRRRSHNPVYLAGNPRRRGRGRRRSRNPGMGGLGRIASGDTLKQGLSAVATVGTQLTLHRFLFGVERPGIPGSIFNLIAGYGGSYLLQRFKVISPATGAAIEKSSIFVAALPWAQQLAAQVPGPETPVLARFGLGRAIIAANRTSSRLDGGRMGRAVISANRTASRLDGTINAQNTAKQLHGGMRGVIAHHRLPQA